jgi:hypothetical protein
VDSRIKEIQKIKIAPDEALIVTVRSDNMEASDLREIQRSLVSVIPNSDMGRVVVVNIGTDEEIKFTTIDMERK